MTVQRVAVVVFAEVEAEFFGDASHAVETAVRQALFMSARVPGMARGYVQAEYPNGMRVSVKVKTVQEMSVALRESLVVNPATRVFRDRSMEDDGKE